MKSSGERSQMSHLQEFSKTCWVLQQDGKNSKLDPKLRQFIFVGIADNTKGYRYYNSQTHQTLTFWNIIFKAKEDMPYIVELELSHPMLLEGESEISNNKQPSGKKENNATSNLPEKEVHASAASPSCIPIL